MLIDQDTFFPHSRKHGSNPYMFMKILYLISLVNSQIAPHCCLYLLVILCLIPFHYKSLVLLANTLSSHASLNTSSDLFFSFLLFSQLFSLLIDIDDERLRSWPLLSYYDGWMTRWVSDDTVWVSVPNNQMTRWVFYINDLMNSNGYRSVTFDNGDGNSSFGYYSGPISSLKSRALDWSWSWARS